MVSHKYDAVLGDATASYEWQVRTVGDEPATVAGPVPITITPAELVALQAPLALLGP